MVVGGVSYSQKLQQRSATQQPQKTVIVTKLSNDYTPRGVKAKAQRIGGIK